MDNNLKPVLKWAGGKRQLIKYIKNDYPQKFNNYFEPFIGGGAVFFDLQPKKKTYINDFNPEIINVYETIKNSPNELIQKLEKHNKNHSKEYYYTIRNLDRDEVAFSHIDNISKAARTIYLNRTCYNGLFRVNRKGYFNTPMGRYVNPLICDKDNIMNVSSYFNSSKINFSCGDFSKILLKAKEKDFVYLDPPYFPISETSSFTDYTKIGFTKDDQIRLLETCNLLNDKKVLFMQSNSDCDFIWELYQDYKIERVPVKRYINSKGNERTQLFELIIRNY